MTTPDPNVLDFAADVNRKITDADRLPFKIGGGDYTLIRPKQFILVAIVSMTDQVAGVDPDNLTSTELRIISQVVDMLLSNVEQPGQARIRRRLADPMDGLDLMQFLPMAQDLVGALSPRPTTAQPESS